MGVISYNSEEMEAVAKSYKNMHDIVTDIKKHMDEDVENIRANWSGDDAITANNDLTAIETQISSVTTNIDEIQKLIKKVMDDFGQLSYKKGDDSNG